MTEYSVVGKSVPRVDALEKVTGKAKFCPDLELPGMLYVKVLRSPYPHARILSIDTSKVGRLPGVKAVVTGKDIPDEKIGYIQDRYILARDVARFVGEPVAAVAARTIEIAEEALELIEVDYEELPAVFDAEEAMNADPSVTIHPDLVRYPRTPVPMLAYRFEPDRPNVFLHRLIRKGDVVKGFQEADLVTENRFSLPRVHHCQMESHATVVQVEPDGGLTVWATEQTAARTKYDLCRIFGLLPSRVRMITPYVGGGFGGKTGIMATPLAMLMALKTRSSVKLVYTREEAFVDGYSRNPAVIYIKDGVKRDGTVVAREIKLIINGGAYSGRVALVINNAPFGTVGTYRVPNFKLDSYGVFTNEPPSGPYRCFGSELVIWAIESHLDMIAERLSIDPVEIRRKNVLREGDENVTGGITYNIGARECLDKVAEFLKWDKKPQVDAGPWKKGKGIALGNKYTMAGTSSVVIVKVHGDGVVEIRHSAQEMGQGCNTILAQIAAEEFGVSMDRVKVVYTDTAVTPYDFGSVSSRSTFHTGNALRLACQDAKQQIFERVAEKLGVPVNDLDTKEGKVYVKGRGGKEVRITDLFNPGGYLPKGGEIIGKATYTCPISSMDPETGQGERLVAYYSHEAFAIEVAVNVETGEVKVLRMGGCLDTAQSINPRLCEGQIEGAMAMGIGQGLYEQMLIDEKGKVVNPNFRDYKLPTTDDLPNNENVWVALAGVPHREGPFGAKGVGEVALTPMLPAIANAVYNAVGVRVKELPITSEKVLQALKARAEASGK